MATINDLISALGDGKGNSRHANQLENTLHMDVGHTQEPTRDLIRDAIVEHEIPIGSTPQDGYFLIDSEEELYEAINNLQQRIEGLQNRIKGLNCGWLRRQESRTKGGNWPK
ncbi:MAG: hypothetical protein FJ123_06090 [Deltaproteobacteria bacterium]|nr:hypothetical protein [Deltaproteobacteria bacterium]